MEPAQNSGVDNRGHSPLAIETGISPSALLEPKTAQHLSTSIERITAISRSFQGVSDTSISQDKMKLAKPEGEELSQAVRANFASTVPLLLEKLLVPLEGPLEVQRLFEHTAHGVNEGLLVTRSKREGDDTEVVTPLYRTWNGHPGQPDPKDIFLELGSFHLEFLERHQELLATTNVKLLQIKSDTALRFAAWIEKRYNHELHPLYDGCGRTSKAFAVAALLMAGVPYPKFSGRDRYIELRSQPIELWTADFAAHIPELA